MIRGIDLPPLTTPFPIEVGLYYKEGDHRRATITAGGARAIVGQKIAPTPSTPLPALDDEIASGLLHSLKGEMERRLLEHDYEKLNEGFMKPEIQHDIRGFVLGEEGVFSMDEFMSIIKNDWPHIDATIEYIGDYRGRLSAPGYLDTTEWTAGESELEVKDHLVSLYGND